MLLSMIVINLNFMRIQKHYWQKSNTKKLKVLTIFQNQELINKVEKFKVEKELMLALMGIETNFGTYVGKWIFYSLQP